MEEKLLDLLSSLPDEILCRIIAFLPCESALETSFLSTRWRDLWNTALVQRGTIEAAATAISGFLTQFDERDPLRQPRKLRYHFCKDGVLLATIAANNKLYVDFSAGKQGFSKQFGWKLELNRQNLTNLQPSSSTAATFVKTLHLKSVSSQLTSEAVSSMVSNFQFLENLKIVECNGLEALEIDAGLKLLSLTILDCPQLKSLHMRSSKLRYFKYRGLLPWLWPEDHFNLKDAMLDFRQGPGDISFKSGDFDATLLTIKNAETLTLCRWTFETLIWPSISCVLSHFQFYKLKELWWIDNYTERYNSDALISFLKLCPALGQLFVTIDPSSYSIPNSTATYSKQDNRNPELEHLKVIKMEGFRNQEDETLLAEQLRKLATVDPQIIATSDRNGSRSFVKVPSYQPKLQCGSPPWSQNGKRANKFAQVMGSEVYPKHAHMGP
ncbi:hypothetical protein F2P56_017088 [Juglans regia]|uniref:F-box domain-containing protein n=2 Tax=Juglans regia TaxID=51240 RepID=A0A834CXL7_JUGRE|nr:F-box protein At2g39490 [Juglans regia]KAF5467241.1 hypothetical protein F2P56_017088 [Juglans regia]